VKSLSLFRPTVPTNLVRETVEHPNGPPTKITPRRQPRLPRDSYIAFSSNPTELHINMTIRKPEHLEALVEALQMYAPQIEIGQRRERED
jgi:hypothetical protein